MISKSTLLERVSDGKIFTAHQMADEVLTAWDNTPDDADEESFFSRYFDFLKKEYRIVTKHTFTEICLFAPWSTDNGKVTETKEITGRDIVDFEQLLANF